MWNEEQLTIIESTHSHKQIIAAAGSGKTATMIGLLRESENKGKIAPDRTLVVTFTNKATDEFKHRIEKNSLSKNYNVSTFHAFCFRSILEFHPYYKTNPMKILSSEEKEKFSIDFLQNYKFQIGGIPFPVLFQKDSFFFRKEYPEIYSSYAKALEEWKNKIHKFEFEDLPRIVEENLSAKVSWTRNLKERFDHIIVDEFQDTDFSQLNILKFMDPENITIVGDDWQAIYGFRGATPEPFLTFPKYFPKTKQFTLSTNYRSLKGIIELSTLALVKNKRKIEKDVRAFRLGETSFQKYVLENPKSDRKSLLPILKSLFETDSDSIILVRSNFRKKEWIDIGIEPNQIMTIHAAKGLEFGTVILDLSSGWNLPEQANIQNLEEERRILYVGISRAKDRLVLIGKKENKNKFNLEDTFFKYFRHFDHRAKPTLRQRLSW
ncbi:MAG: UvrD family DEAD/DEAH box helicase [Leptospira sp.]|nr:UvrD family DEAD/DEAH box helicase [Leptospira sp.]